MRVNSVDNGNVYFKSGLYFTTVPVKFDKNADFAQKVGVKVSQEGFKYIERPNISAPIIKKFQNNKFVKNLAEKFDTFVLYEEIPQNKKSSSNFIVMAKIWWFDNIKNAGQYKGARGLSRSSKDHALDKMFKELK